MDDLRTRFDEVLAQLESVAGWKTARVRKPVLILGSLGGIETGVRQLMRDQPLETTVVKIAGNDIRLPTLVEMLRVKAILILRRNATRDYIDFAALSDALGEGACTQALQAFDELYPQESGESALQQLQAQLAQPLPFDLDETNLREYKGLAQRWQTWDALRHQCMAVAQVIFESLPGPPQHSAPRRG